MLRMDTTARPASTAAIVAVVAAMVLTACAQGERAAENPPTAADLVHVHGLDESEDGLFVATHTGLFEIARDRIERVGDAAHDLMGFTVAGPGDLLASGHPDLRVEELLAEGKPPHLGLVHSVDGETWEPLSLLGEADFHSLVAAHDRIYGFDSTGARFMVSSDRRQWDVRAEQLGIADFAVSPENPETVVAAVQEGTARSNDGGREWRLVGREPYLFLSWTADGLYGAAANGEVAQSEDAGETWQARGRLPGAPEALHVGGDGVIYASVAGSGIYRSADGGATFDVLVRTGEHGS